MVLFIHHCCLLQKNQIYFKLLTSTTSRVLLSSNLIRRHLANTKVIERYTKDSILYNNYASTVSQKKKPTHLLPYYFFLPFRSVYLLSACFKERNNLFTNDPTAKADDFNKTITIGFETSVIEHPASDENKSLESLTEGGKAPSTSKNRIKTDFTKTYTANIFVPISRAMSEFYLESSEIEQLPKFTRRSPYPQRDKITVYKRVDLVARAIEKWGSLENLQLQKNYKKNREYKLRSRLSLLKQEKNAYVQEHFEIPNSEKPYIYLPIDADTTEESTFLKMRSTQVVNYAILVNAVNCIVKFGTYLFTGSHSMFSEFLHSLADTFNQLLLALGLWQSMKKPDLTYPYGWMKFRNIASLISGVGIFLVGAGLSVYHGIIGLLHPAETKSLLWALLVLIGSLISEGGTFIVAYNELKIGAKKAKMTFYEYVIRNRDPSTSVILLEDATAVTGIFIAAGCIGISQLTGSHVPDAVGSLIIGSLLGTIASFIIYSNTVALIGTSIPPERRLQMMRDLEKDRMIRTLHDVKATEAGGKFIKFKAEIDFDGKEVTRYYLEQLDLDKLLQQMQQVKSIDEAESFMLGHGENIIDTLGVNVDRIERDLKKKYPEIRHCDLEQL